MNNLLAKARLFEDDNCEGGSFDDITQSSQMMEKVKTVVNIPLTELENFTDADGKPQPFTVDTKTEDFKSLYKSMEVRGQLAPINVRRLGNGKYQIVSGHQRAEVRRLQGHSTVMAIVEYVPNDEIAYDMMVDANIQRKVTPIELAKIFRYHLDHRKSAIRDSTKTADDIAAKFGIKKKQMYKYVKILLLSPQLQACFEKSLAHINCAELLYNAKLTVSQQNLIANYLSSEDAVLSVKLCRKLIEVADNKPDFDMNDIDCVFHPELNADFFGDNAAEQVKTTTTITHSFSSPFYTKLASMFPNQMTGVKNDTDMEALIIALLRNGGAQNE